MTIPSVSRRHFLNLIATLPLLRSGPSFAQSKPRPICVFSKHLQFLDYTAMAETAAEIGFDGVDLAVRPGGHVLPERVADDLPRAVEAVRKAGLLHPMMTTAITDSREAHAETTLATASRLGIRHYRLGNLDYRDDLGIVGSLKALRPQLRDLAAMNERLRIHGAYQNHDGRRVGAPVWDLYHLLEDLDPQWMGCQYDVRHATAEGGRSWILGLKLIRPWIRTTVIKDFHWSKDGRGRWRAEHVPLGAGMVDFAEYFKVVREHDIAGPISVHFEYPLTEEPEQNLSPAERRRQTMASMRKDLLKLRQLMRDGGL